MEPFTSTRHVTRSGDGYGDGYGDGNGFNMNQPETHVSKHTDGALRSINSCRIVLIPETEAN